MKNIDFNFDKNPPSSLQHQRNGFTLIELLVVITLIVLLIALLLPTLADARQSAQSIKNLANMRGVQMALFEYASNNKDTLIVSRLNGYVDVTYVNWPGLIYGEGYVSDPFVFWGPMRDTAWLAPLRSSILANPITSTAYYCSGYSLNHYGAYVSEKSIIQDEIYPRRLTNASRLLPSKILSMTDMFDTDRYSDLYGWQDGICQAEICPNSGVTTRNFFTWRGAVARTYLDGHALSTNAIDLGYSAIDSRNGVWINYGFPYGILEPWYDLRAPNQQNF